MLVDTEGEGSLMGKKRKRRRKEEKKRKKVVTLFVGSHASGAQPQAVQGCKIFT